MYIVLLFSSSRIKESGEFQLSFNLLLLGSGSREGNWRYFWKRLDTLVMNFNTMLHNCQESLGIENEEEHLYSSVTMSGWGNIEHP